MSYAGYYIRRYIQNEPIENTNINNINISQAYKSNNYTYGFTITFCIIFAILLLFTTFAIYLQFQRLVLGDALKKAEEENSSTSLSDESVTDSNQDIDDNNNSDTSSDESGDTLDEYGFINEKKTHKYLFQDDKSISDTDGNPDIDYKSNPIHHHTNNTHIEMQTIDKNKNKKNKNNKNKNKNKNKRNKSKHRL
eukprot:883558_1